MTHGVSGAIARHWPWGGHTSSARGSSRWIQLVAAHAARFVCFSCACGGLAVALVGVCVYCVSVYMRVFRFLFYFSTSVFSHFLFHFLFPWKLRFLLRSLSVFLCACAMACCVYMVTAHVHLPCVCFSLGGRAERSICRPMRSLVNARTATTTTTTASYI